MSDNSHAAMCVYCGEAVIYDTRQVTDMEAAHKKIVEHDQRCPRNPLVGQVEKMDAAVFALFGYLSEHHPDACADICRAFTGTTWESMAQRKDAMATFVNEAINACFDGGSLDGGWIQERGEELGLLEAVEYDPAVHHIDCEMTDPGDRIYVRAAWLGTKSEEKQG